MATVSANGLTENNEIFLRLLIKGKTQLEAYRIAFNNHTAQDNTLGVKASKLFKRPELQARFKELQQKSETEFIKRTVWTKERAIELLEFVNDAAHQQIKNGKDVRGIGQIITGNINVLNKMFGYDSSETPDGDKPVPVGFDFKPVVKAKEAADGQVG